MSAASPEDRIRELVGDLRPVRRIPALRIAFAFALFPWLVGIPAEWLLGTSQPRALSDPFWSAPFALAILAGLLLLGLGSTVAALASAVPDRAGTMRRALALAAIGAAIALSGALLQLSGPWSTGDPVWWRGSLGCLTHSVGLGIATSLVACRFVGAAAMRRPGASAAMALAGAVALGAGVVHASCTMGDTLHQLVAHALAPAIAAALLAFPLALGMRRLFERRPAA